MARRPSRPQFAHWFLYSSAYESWNGLKDWFSDRRRDGEERAEDDSVDPEFRGEEPEGR